MKIIISTRIIMITLIFTIFPQLFDNDNVSAEGQSQSVSAKRTERAVRLLRGEKVTPGVEVWQKVCERYQNVPFPAEDKPTDEVATSLAKCISYEIYYGFDQHVDPLKARLCAYDEMDKKREDGPFSGTDMLMTIYANGVGAKRNFPLAIRLACKIEGAPAEMEERIAHLEMLRKQNWRGHDFSLCDDITSGYMQGYCAHHLENFAKIKREKQLKEIQANWTATEKSEYASLRKSASRFFKERTENEVNQSGTARAAMSTEENAILEDAFILLLQNINKGKLPNCSIKKFIEVDSSLNAIYRKVQKGIDDSWETVSNEGIKVTQHEWIRYREAWVAFCIKKFPNIKSNSIKTLLTLQRIEMLRQFIE